MILQALVSYYESLAARNIIAPFAFSKGAVSYSLCIDDNGKIINKPVSLKMPTKDGKSYIGKELFIPEHKYRSGSAPDAYFLCDFSSYLLGLSYEKGKADKKERIVKNEYHERSKRLHHEVLDNIQHPAAKAILSFFDNWCTDNLSDIQATDDEINEILSKANLVFEYNGQYVHEIPEIREAWLKYYNKNEGKIKTCLVTGKKDYPERIHPHFEELGTKKPALVSFNVESFCSYGLYAEDQGANAPTSKYAAFAYGAAIKHLLSKQKNHIGDTTVLFWAENGQDTYSEFAEENAFGNTHHDQYEEKDLKNVIDQICKGRTVTYHDEELDPNMRFYVLGLSSYVARLSVRFFYQNSFGNFVRNVQAHQERLSMVRIYENEFETISLKSIIDQTYRKKKGDAEKSKDENNNEEGENKNQRSSPSSVMVGEIIRSILDNTRYPATLLNAVENRIHADHEVNRTRAAILKAYYLKNPHQQLSKEVLQMSLNTECSDTAYLLGRLFCVLENIQKKAVDPQTTIRDTFFSSASATPIIAFPSLLRLSQNHLKKLDTGLRIYFENLISEILDKMDDNPFPAHLTLPQQCSFQIGYYHQKAYKKEK